MWKYCIGSDVLSGLKWRTRDEGKLTGEKMVEVQSIAYLTPQT